MVKDDRKKSGAARDLCKIGKFQKTIDILSKKWYHILWLAYANSYVELISYRLGGSSEYFKTDKGWRKCKGCEASR